MGAHMTLKPLAHFALHRKYTLRYTRRGEETVQGIFTSKSGEELSFTYRPAERSVAIAGAPPILINEYGWETNERGEVIFSSKTRS